MLLSMLMGKALLLAAGRMKARTQANLALTQSTLLI